MSAGLGGLRLGPPRWVPRLVPSRAPSRVPRWALVWALTSLLLSGCSTLPMWMVLQGQSQITDYQHFDNAPITRAAAPSPLPAAPAALNWPGGLDNAAAEADIAQHGTVALLVARRGQLIYERYFNGYSADSIATSFSLAKSVVSVLLGIAIDL